MSSASWDAEQVLAFVHDTKPYAEMDDAERTEWCRRVKHVRDTSDGVWTTERLAGLFGLTLHSLKSRFSRSAGVSGGGGPAGKPESARKLKPAIRNSTPQEVAAAIIELPREHQAQIMRTVEQQSARGPRPAPTPAEQKAAQAHASAATQPLRAPLAGMQILAAIEKVTDLLRECRPNGDLLKQIDEALEELTLARHELDFKLEEDLR